MEIDVGQVIGGKYALQRLLGTGAMGQVWSARHETLQQQVAIKLMVPLGSSQIGAVEGEATSLKRFANEAQIAAALSRKSRHIAAVTDFGVEDGVAYLAMELLEGETLDRRLASGALAPNEVADVVQQIAKGLFVAHAEGVTHRDLKPANVFITHTEEGSRLVKLLDFGIALMARRIVKSKDNRAPTKLTMKGIVLGSPAYMSPEQAMAEPSDVRADVWSLAVLAYQALTGVTPFDALTPDETILRICNFRPTPIRKFMPNASDALVDVFVKAFAPSVSKRFQTAPELAGALTEALGSPVTSLPTPGAIVAGTPRLPMRSNLVPIVAIGALCAIVIGVVAYVVPHASTHATSAAPSVTTSAPSIAPPPAVSQIATASAIAPTPAPPPIATHTHHAHTPGAPATTVSPIVTTFPTTTSAPTMTAAPVKSVDRSGVF
jgi:serine/threonine-protein kinase